MIQNSKAMSAWIMLILAVLACNGPFANSPQPVAPEIQTSAAQTLQVILTPSSNPITSTVQSPLNTNTSSPTSSTSIPKSTITPTYSVPMLTVLEQTNCRMGPGQDYEVVFTYLSGKKLEIVGRYDPDNYWLVKSAESPTGTCWLWGEYVEVTGSYWVVSSVTPPPTATKAPPEAPSIQEWKFSCSGTILTFTVSWTDRASNETGYRVFRNGEAVAELPPNSTSFVDTFDTADVENVDYSLQVFSPYGSANSSVMRMTC